MTAAMLARPTSSPASGCRYAWCTGVFCSADSNDNMHKGRSSQVRDEHHDYDVRVCPMAFDFDDGTSSEPIVEVAIEDADDGCGVYANCGLADAFELGAVLTAAGTAKAPRGHAVTVRTNPGPHVGAGTVTIELLDESFDMIVGLSARDVRIPLVKVTVEGDGETSHEECRIFASCARDLGCYLQLAAYEVKQS